ncbi:MAG: hypothetical protein A2W79_18715 [Pseudomonadales bacterium RIFCSPLOWO2_12_60_38]|jgi:hypothetical protein|nr:hypothetical protein H096_11753 [Pseudomonas sp. FH1]OHC33143.1 MAG: hypothetical protein A2W79_18715 [Pseudomonadales bacterium RIFCSPLOWO2_12_60_38]OHC42169.1 MAG: hypothetical protein A3G72_10075 [Pseudomonadales bacterium RIFCSPLOWO2_12_FULL_59_450]
MFNQLSLSLGERTLKPLPHTQNGHVCKARAPRAEENSRCSTKTSKPPISVVVRNRMLLQANFQSTIKFSLFDPLLIVDFDFFLQGLKIFLERLPYFSISSEEPRDEKYKPSLAYQNLQG